MSSFDGLAIVWCDGAFNTPEGKTAHGLVRFTERYRVISVIDRKHAGQDAGDVLDGKPCGIPIVEDLDSALDHAEWREQRATHLVVGLAPDGGRLPAKGRAVVRQALEAGLDVDSGLHDFLGEDPVLASMAQDRGAVIRDIRRPPHRSTLHSFTGRISEVRSRRIAVLGTDSAVGKRTTAWMMVHEARRAGLSCELIGTGQTACLQGARYCLVLDSLVNDFVAGELENAVLRAWDEQAPDLLFIEGQGSLMNPAYPGGLEILAATRPDGIVLQHAPTRTEYDGFPGNPLHPIELQIQALELVGGRPVMAIAMNHEGLRRDQVEPACEELRRRTGLPVCAPLIHGVGPLLEAIGE